MERNNLVKRMLAAAMVALLLALPACGKNAPAQDAAGNVSSAETLKGVYEALLAPDSDYSQNKALYLEFYPELEYSESLETDRINLSRKANGNEYFTDSSTDFVLDGDYLSAVIAEDDFVGIARVTEMANAVAGYLGMETDLVSGYLNGLSDPAIETENFSMTEDEAAGTFTFRLYVGGPWDMKELDRMVLNEAVLDPEPLGEDYTSQGGSVGKMQYLANGNADNYTVLFAEYGELDDVAYQSIVNLVTLRKPVGCEAFLADFTELKALETDQYSVTLDPDDDTIAQIMGERNDKFSYVLVRFGSEENREEETGSYVPGAEAFADFYFRVVAGLPQGTAGASLAASQAACDVLGFAWGNELWLADEDTLRANMLEAWEGLTDEERAAFDANFPALDEQISRCFEDWESNRGAFEDAGVADTMTELLEDGSAQLSWETLSANTWAKDE